MQYAPRNMSKFEPWFPTNIAGRLFFKILRFFWTILMPAPRKKTNDQNLYTAMVGRWACLPRMKINIVDKIPELIKKARKIMITQIQ